MNDDSDSMVNGTAVASEKVNAIRQSISRILIGQNDVVDQVLIALLCGGHVLIEGVPGLGKTLLVRSLAACFDGSHKRIQFTPDLMPADITGHTIYDMREGKFHVRKGPVFTNLLLADEINRSPAKTQAALLEVMQEKQVTIEGTRLSVELPFMVLATQNPIEQEGTYPLPEAELDRFLLKIFIDYPSHEDEVKLTQAVTHGSVDDALSVDVGDAKHTPQDILQLQKMVANIAVDQQVMDYAVRIVRATRNSPAIVKGAGPRACIGLVRAARANAFLRGENFVLPDDVKAMALPVMRHRIILSADMEINGQTADNVLAGILDTVEAPRL
ncbi:MAG: MoxR family ATPase [Gammaproteobacteria bacterium]|nr:MoxR family ATPase [Gammaproteobacteria bacterium]MDH5803137.1 MoxR family ATPase [Gammaproteobacteria bacterium]